MPENLSSEISETTGEAEISSTRLAPDAPSARSRSGVSGGFAKVWRAVSRDRSVRAAVLPFVLTRVIIFFVLVFTAQINIYEPAPPKATEIRLHKIQFSRLITERVLIMDSGWYINMAEHGYERRPFTAERQANWAFFPLFPLVLHLASKVTREFVFSGIIISGMFFFGALVFLHKATIAFGFNEPDADRAIFYLAAFPVSYFFALPLTESLFLFLVVSSFYAARREWWLAAGLLGALASATRMTGIVMLPALVMLYWETYRTLRPRLNFLPVLLVPAGLLAFMYYLYHITGNPLAFKDVAATWGRQPGFFLSPLLDYLSDPLLVAKTWDFRLVNFLAAMMALINGVILLKWRRWSLALFTLASMFVSLSSSMLQAQARYAMVLFPVFIVLAVAGRSPRVDAVIRTASLILLVLMTVMFSLSLDIVLS